MFKIEVLDSCVPEGLPLAEQIKHGSMTIYIEGGSRVFTHELVRHRRDMSYSQQSQRYVDERGFQFVVPDGLSDENVEMLALGVESAKLVYKALREDGIKKQDARYILPNAVEAPIVVTGTWKAWLHFLKLRTDKAAQPEMRKLAGVIGMNAAATFPEAFGDHWFVKGALIITQEFGLDYEISTRPIPEKEQ